MEVISLGGITLANNYYVYEHIRPDTMQVFYVGKGKGKRITIGKNGGGERNKHWHHIVNKASGFISRKIVENVDEELAFLAEQERIDQLKRLGVKLCNMTDGGEGASGTIVSKETREKMSKIHKGKTISDEQKKKMSESLKKVVKSKEWVEKIASQLRGRKRDNSKAAKSVSKPVICTTTNLRFNSCREAAKFYNVSVSGVSKVCKGHIKHIKNLVFKHIEMD